MNTVKAYAAPLDRTRQSLKALLMAGLCAGALIAAQPAEAQPAGAPESFAELVEDMGPAVVNIATTTTIEMTQGGNGVGPMIPEGSPFEDMLRDFFDQIPQMPQQSPQQRPPRSSNALGSGFVISADGYVVTNNHVIDGADKIEVEFQSGNTLQAKVIGTDPKTDIALLKVDADEPLPFARFGDSDAARVGDWVLAIGNPLGQGFSVSQGIVSARGRSLQGNYDDFIQTDAAINRGNSGGPLFNMQGEVIGVNTAILSPNGGSIGIGFSMSSNVVEQVVEQLREYGETRRGWLGVQIQNINEDMSEALGLESTNGALVSDVPEGPARMAGIETGDVITAFNGEEVDDVSELIRLVGEAEVGSTARVVVFRDGQTETLRVELGRLEDALGETNGDEQDNPDQPETPETAPTILGMTLAPLNAETRDTFGLPDDAQGVVVMELEGSSEAFEKGLRAGDVISEAAQTSISSVEDLRAAVETAREEGKSSVLFLVRREGQPRFVAVPLTEDE
ncbi:DegQ family serine endoprotease [Paracoccaceae bacterium GXU_MW_L88]